MGEKSDTKAAVTEVTTIDVSPTPPREGKKKRVALRRTPTYSKEVVEDDSDSPIRYILYVQNKVDVKQLEEVDDCFILDFDPCVPIQLSKLSVADDDAIRSNLTELNS